MPFTAADCQTKIALYSAAIDARLGRGGVKRSSFGGDSLEHYSLAELEAGLALWRRRLAAAQAGTGVSFVKTANGIPS